MSGDYLTRFLEKCKADDGKSDSVINVLLKYIISTDKTLSSETRDAYETLQQLINGGNNTQDLDPRSVALIREAYNELLQEMASVDIDEKSIKSMLTPEAFDSV